MDLRASRTLGLDTYMDQHQLDAVLFRGTSSATECRRSFSIAMRSQ